MEFMSVEHVDTMNALLAEAHDVRAACSRLPRPYVIAYRLTDGPSGAIVHWTATFDGTVRFALTEHPRPDVVLVADWRDMIRSSAAGRRGESYEASVTYVGDEGALDVTGPALEQARAIATVPVDFPDV